MNKRRILLSSVCVILLVALIGVSYAWFFVNEEVSVGYGDSIFCQAGDNLEIILGDGSSDSGWTSFIDYRPAENFSIVDISGNGEELFRPAEVDEHRRPGEMLDALAGRDYAELVVTFRSLSETKVYLSDESYIRPHNEKDYANEYGYTNIYGDFSRDFVAGAMRVAVLDENENLLMLWAPNSQYELVINRDEDGNELGTYSFVQGDKAHRETEYYYYAKETEGQNAGKVVLKKVTADMFAEKHFIIDKPGLALDDAQTVDEEDKDESEEDVVLGIRNSPLIASLVPANKGDMAKKTIIIRVWFEGTDREAHQALAGGNIDVLLKFEGLDKAENTNSLESVKTLKDIKDGMWFSTDGWNWTEYQSATTTLPDLAKGESIYVKYPETKNFYETDCKKLIID